MKAAAIGSHMGAKLPRWPCRDQTALAMALPVSVNHKTSSDWMQLGEGLHPGTATAGDRAEGAGVTEQPHGRMIGTRRTRSRAWCGLKANGSNASWRLIDR